MWPRRSHTLAPLTKLTPIKKYFKCMGVEQDGFEKIKRIVASDNLSTYLDFIATLKMNTNAIVFQLGAVIFHNGKPIAFYSRKLTYAQQRCTVMERELLSII